MQGNDSLRRPTCDTLWKQLHEREDILDWMRPCPKRVSISVHLECNNMVIGLYNVMRALTHGKRKLDMSEASPATRKRKQGIRKDGTSENRTVSSSHSPEASNGGGHLGPKSMSVSECAFQLTPDLGKSKHFQYFLDCSCSIMLRRS
jgi:hypothetical protein